MRGVDPDLVTSAEAAPLTAVVVPLDGSRFAERAVLEADDLALRLGVEVVLLSVVPKAQGVHKREGVLAAVEVASPFVRREVVVDPDPVGAISEMVRHLRSAVVCVASRGRGRSAALTGSFAAELVARGQEPVIVVGPLLDERLPGHGIVVCIDDAPSSEAVYPAAVRWGALLREPMTVITVAEPAPEPLRGIVRRAFGPDGDVETFLDLAVEPLRDVAPSVRAMAVYDPISPAEGVCSYVEASPASLVAVCSHARTGIERVAFGSVTAAIVQRCHAPILVAPRPAA
jgi:nucleotide-binding universal stress UspA family protein